jgi:hypothetical protein
MSTAPKANKANKAANKVEKAAKVKKERPELTLEQKAERKQHMLERRAKNNAIKAEIEKVQNTIQGLAEIASTYEGTELGDKITEQIAALTEKGLTLKSQLAPGRKSLAARATEFLIKRLNACCEKSGNNDCIAEAKELLKKFFQAKAAEADQVVEQAETETDEA